MYTQTYTLMHTYTELVVTWGAWDAYVPSNAPQLTDLFAHDLLSSSGYPMITYTHPGPVASKNFGC